MMTNEEKYPKTEDALAAFGKHKEECKCDCKFESWLKQLCDEEIERAAKDMPRGLGVALAGLLAGSLVADAIKGHFKDEKIDGIECPLCHGKNGKIGGILTPVFKCPDCGAVIGCKRIEDNDAFAKWFSQFNRKQG